MTPPNYIGPLTPQQVVKIRAGRFSRYQAEANYPSGAGHQPWNEALYPCQARVGAKEGPGGNVDYLRPWQAIWLPTTPYDAIPNVQSVKLDKQLEDGIGVGGQAAVEIENILYTAQLGGHHVRERGALAPLRGVVPPGNPVMPTLLGEIEEAIASNEWAGRFATIAQVTVFQGYGAATTKTFTGLIEGWDATSRPDRITLTVRDFGLVLTDEHFFGWGKDPIISTPVVFVDALEASSTREIGYNPHSSDEDLPDHSADQVLDFDESTNWQTNTVHSPEQTEYVEIALKQGDYRFADIAVRFAGMEMFVALRAADRHFAGVAEAPQRNGILMTRENKWLDKDGWVDPTKAEGQIVPGANGGNSYTNHIVNYPTGQQRTPIQPGEPEAVFSIGDNSVLRLSFRKLHKVEAGENYRAGVKEMHGLKEAITAAGAKAEWVTTEDISDVIRVLCQWAGFKEWDIPDTGARLPVRIVANPAETYIDVIKRVCAGIGWNFYIADPTPDGESFGGGSIEALGGSLGVPTFRQPRVVVDDVGAIPVITDRSLLTAINVKGDTAALAYIIRVYGRTLTQPGDAAAGILGGRRLVYTFRPPWTGTPPTYADSRIAGVLKPVVHHDPFFATPEDCRNAAWFIALQQALASIVGTVEFPANPAIDLESHARLMDLGTGISTRIAAVTRSSTFTDGEKRKWTMQVTGPLIDTPDVRDMVNIIQAKGLAPFPANGTGKEWGDARVGSGSTLGYE